MALARLKSFSSVVLSGLPCAPLCLSSAALLGLRAGQALLLTLAMAMSATSLALVAGLSPLPTMAGAILAGAIGLGAYLGGDDAPTRLFLAVITTVVLGLALAAASFFIDGSYDGQEYHYDTIYALVHGWNPFREPYAAYAPPQVTILIWPQHYPVGAPLLTALVRSTGLSLAAAKGITWLPGIAVPAIWYALLRGEGLARRGAAPMALLAAASPIYIEQLRSHYVDGLVAALAMAFVGLLIVALRHRRMDTLACAAACLVLAVDTKFNAIAIFGAVSAALCLTMAFQRRFAAALTLGFVLLGALLCVVFVLGSFPYLTNWRDFGHPFYPVMGTDAYGVNKALLPGGVRALPAIVVFFGTTFSVFVRGFAGGAAAFFDFSEGGLPDAAVGGFGPIFGVTLFSALAIALLALRARRNAALSWAGRGGQLTVQVIFPMAMLLLVSSLVTPYMWWPRFIPQLWICVYLCLVGAVLSGRGKLATLGWACAAVLALNSLVVSVNTVRNGLRDTDQVREHIARVKARGGPYCAAFGAAHARIELMREAGIGVEPISTGLPVQCKASEVIPLADDFLGNPAQACACDDLPASQLGDKRRPVDTTLADIRRLYERNK